MSMTTTAVHMDSVTAALNALGITEHTRVAKVQITPHNVVITRRRINEDGKQYIDKDTGVIAVEVEEMVIYWTDRGQTTP